MLLQLFNVWVEPLVEVVVHLSEQKDFVKIEVRPLRFGLTYVAACHVDMPNPFRKKVLHPSPCKEANLLSIKACLLACL